MRQGRVCMELVEMLPEHSEQNLADRDMSGGTNQYSGNPLVLRALWVELRLSYLNAWFGTAHSST